MTGAFEVQDARREKQKALVGFIGPSGAGKTVGALLVAYGMMKEAYPDLEDEKIWKKIGVADTEHNRSMLYVGQVIGETEIGSFKHIDFEPPYSTERYLQALVTLKRAGVEVVIIDSLSHNWNGKGGILEIHGSMSGNSFQNWNKANVHVTDMVSALVSNDIHILATLRTKNEYVMELNEKGKQQPVKIGTKPVQKDDMEYEFMLNFSVNMDHTAIATKDNTNLFSEEMILNEDVGRKLYRYLELGVDVKAEEQAQRDAYVKDVKEWATADENIATLLNQSLFKKQVELPEQLALTDLKILHTFLGGKANVQN